MGLIYISILFIAIAFLIVTVYICFVLKRMTNTMMTLGRTLQDVEKQVETMKPEILSTIKESDALVDDVAEKVEATDSMFDSVQSIGESIQSANTVLQENMGNLTDEEMDRKLKPYIEGIKWSEAGVQLFTQWRSNKREGKNELIVRNQKEIMNVPGKEG